MKKVRFPTKHIKMTGMVDGVKYTVEAQSAIPMTQLPVDVKDFQHFKRSVEYLLRIWEANENEMG